MRPIINRIAMAGVAVLVCCTFAAAAHAQSHSTVAICPAVFEHNGATPTAQREAIRSIQDRLQNAGYTVLSYQQGERRWTDMDMPVLSAGNPATRRDLARFGEMMHARYVIAPTFDIHTHTTLNAGERITNTDATVGLKIVNVPSREIVYSRTATFGRTREGAGVEPAGTPAVRTVREDRAIDIAVRNALNDWINQNS